ncbi:MAG: flagellar basal body P-ring formation chaperone FlgA [Gammaproteobacteria bacterium]|nr:flagellar basal body P-ring formation chaperone FlgA [Gammaproteobacteria bacterium]
MEKTKRRRRNPNVDFLTSLTGVCHKTDSRIAAILPTMFAVLAPIVPAAVFADSADAWQPADTILATAENFVKDRYGRNDRRMRPIAGHLDARLRLPRCSETLEAFVGRGTKISSRTIVGVRCSGTKPWKVYVPVEVIVTESVLVSRRTLPKGHLLTADDVILEQRDISMFRSGYLSSTEELAEQRLKRQIDGGRVITPAMLVADILIRRGQMVTIVVKNDQMHIRMAGRALSDGALNQRIRVENSNSRRVVEGVVRSPEYVEILVR